MPTPPQPDPTPDGARNLFLDADPIDYDALEPGGPASKPTAPRRRGHGRVIALDRPSPIATATSHSGRAARFTRPTAGIARLRMPALARIRGLVVLAERLLSRIAAQPSVALTALVVLLIALGWLGVELRNTSVARRVAERRLAAATTTLDHDRARIDALWTQLGQAALTARRQQTTQTAAHARRPTAERTPARGRHRRH
jgi:hypothetical protein